MISIRNNLNQRIIINLVGGKSIDLLAGGTARITEAEFASPHVKALAAKGTISVSESVQKKKKDPGQVVKRRKQKQENGKIQEGGSDRIVE